VTLDEGELTLALAIAREAGALLLEGYGGRHEGRAKGSAIDLVTEYDTRSQDLILERLTTAFPGDEVLAEEGDGLNFLTFSGGRRWLVDPLDGTTNFAHGLPVFCVNLALQIGASIELAVTHAPVMGLTFAGRRNQGATCNGTPLRVSDTGDLGRALLATGFPYDRHTSPENNFDQFVAFQKRAQGVRRMGSAAIDLALVARGAFDGYWEMKLKPWDLAAGVLLVEEAGGRVTAWDGGPPRIDRGGGAIVASNGRIHDALLGVLAQVGIPQAAR
jgi:myo-inositol-1(or 4)-monophosphatase